MTGNHTHHNSAHQNSTQPLGACVSCDSGYYRVAFPTGGLSVRHDYSGQGTLTHCELPESEVLKALVVLFEQVLELRSINLTGLSFDSLTPLIYQTPSGESLLWREVAMQCPLFWLQQDYFPIPNKLVLSEAGYHPMRPRPQQGVLYQRYIPELQQNISLLGLDIDKHALLFNKWQNSERVSAFWDQKGTLEEHTAYLKDLLADYKNQLIIVCLDDEPFAYIEAYWAKEDRIAPYYSVGDHDRGIHMLVGEEHHRGAHKVAAWLPSVCHYLYLTDPRTDKIVSEPRSDNQKMIGYLQQYGFAKLKEFDFPHKRSALMSQLRESFFADCF